MSADYTTTGLIANCRRRGAIPVGSGLTTVELLRVLSEQSRTYIPAFLKGIREEYTVAELNITVTSATVPIPARACGAALRSIAWLQSDGNVGPPLARIEPERRSEYPGTASAPSGFMFQGNNCILLPSVTSGTLVVSYQQRPGELVLASDCAVAAAATNGALLGITGSLPTTFVAGTVCDIVSHAPNFKLLAMDAVISIVTGSVITFTAALPTDIVGGDFLCLANETCIPRVPIECLDLLAQAAAMEIAQSTGSTRLGAIKDGLRDLRAQVEMILSPRADGSARVIVSRSRLGRQ